MHDYILLSLLVYCVVLLTGVCIAQWGDRSLDGHSFEGVQRILEADSELTEVEVGFRKCRCACVYIYMYNK